MFDTFVSVLELRQLSLSQLYILIITLVLFIRLFSATFSVLVRLSAVVCFVCTATISSWFQLFDSVLKDHIVRGSVRVSL